MDDDLTAHLIELELRLQDPEFRKDAVGVAALLAEEFREFGASGRIWGRGEILAELQAETPYRIISEEFACQRLSRELALLTYASSSATRSGWRRTLRSSLWRLEGGHWKMLFHQGTVVPGAGDHSER